MINLDFSSVKSFDLLQDGDYTVRIEKAEEKQTTTGKDAINVTFVVISGETEGRKIFENYLLQENCLWKLKNLLTAIGMDTSGIIDLDPMEMVGRALIAQVITQTYNGNDRNSIKNCKKAPPEFML